MQVTNPHPASPVQDRTRSSGEFVPKKSYDFAQRILFNPLTWTVGQAFCLAGLSAAFLHQLDQSSIKIIAPIIGTGLVVLSCTIYRHHKRLKNEITLIYKIIQNILNPKKHPWWSMISPENSTAPIRLGLVLLKNWDRLIPVRINAVISLWENKKENPKGWLTEHFEKKDCKVRGFVEHKFEVQKDGFLGYATTNKAIEAIKTHVQSTHQIYLHSNASDQAAAVLLACYLLKIKEEKGEPKPVKSVIDYINQKRPGAITSSKQCNAIETYYKRLQRETIK